MGDAVKDLSKGVGQIAKGDIGGGIGSIWDSATPLRYLSSGSPSGPGINPDLQNLQQQQISNAQKFRAGLPGLENQMDTQNKVSAQGQLSAGQSQLNSTNSSRGLGYGGVNQGQQQAMRTGVQKSVAQQSSQVHQGLINESNQMDQAAISTGVAIQNQSQQQQNAIYANAMANMNAQNGIIGSAAGAGLMLALL